MDDQGELVILRTQVAKLRRRIDIMEEMIENHSRDLHEARCKAERSFEDIRMLIDAVPDPLMVSDGNGNMVLRNARAVEGLDSIRPFGDYLPAEWGQQLREHGFVTGEVAWPDEFGNLTPYWASAVQVDDGRIILSGRDLRSRRELELRLLQAQKLESIGNLAAGVAHEINTPLQYVCDSVHFIKEVTGDLLRVAALYRKSVQSAGCDAQLLNQIEQEVDLAFIRDEIPGAFDRALEGIGRVTRIVMAMKEFAHPDAVSPEPSDLNAGIRATAEIARNEYKYTADLVLDLAELPPVYCRIGDINQVVLNLVVNAAHAIAERLSQGERGTISIQTRHKGDLAELVVEDSGPGIPESIRGKIYDPFFTTKEVGKGTGQGLAITRQIITRHGGSIEYRDDCRLGGACFVIQLPLRGNAA